MIEPPSFDDSSGIRRPPVFEDRILTHDQVLTILHALRSWRDELRRLPGTHHLWHEHATAAYLSGLLDTQPDVTVRLHAL